MGVYELLMYNNIMEKSLDLCYTMIIFSNFSLTIASPKLA